VHDYTTVTEGISVRAVVDCAACYLALEQSKSRAVLRLPDPIPRKIQSPISHAHDLELQPVRVTASKGLAFEIDSPSRVVLDDVATDTDVAERLNLTKSTRVRRSALFVPLQP